LVQSLPVSPIDSSNWLVPHRLIIGEHPSTREAVALVQVARVNTFLSLIGEYSTAQYRQQHYPRGVEQHLASLAATSDTSADTDTACGVVRRVDFLHYPIRDFAVTDGGSLQPLVAELKRRLLADDSSVIYIHCRGGHG
jgi:hypothetical protein